MDTTEIMKMVRNELYLLIVFFQNYRFQKAFLAFTNGLTVIPGKRYILFTWIVLLLAYILSSVINNIKYET